MDGRRVSGSGSASANPFRDGAAENSPATPAPNSNPYVLAHAHAPLPTPAPTLSYATPIDVLLGFDPAPNPFKQSKPRIVRPTPVVASASSPVPNPFRNTGASSIRNGRAGSMRSAGSPVSLHSVDAGGAGPFASPPLPPRPLALEKLPPPLPPRQPISPLIQAGLNARSEVRRAKKALPPKTFSVIQSNTGKPQEKAAPRLLTGQTADETVLAQLEGVAAGGSELAGVGGQSHTSGGHQLQGPPKHPETRRRHGHSNSRGTNQFDPRRSVSDIPTHLLRGNSVDMDAPPLPPPQRSPTKKFSGLPQTVAPKPSYNYPEGARGLPVSNRAVSHMSTQSLGRAGAGGIKSGLPSWLEEQEELQRSSLVDGPEEGDGESESVLDNTDAQTLSSQAQSAASIERNHPFFMNKRDVERGFVPVPPDASILKDRPLGRSKTLHGKQAPLVPSRRRLDSSPAYGATSGHAFSSQAPALSPLPPTPGNIGAAAPTAGATQFASALAGKYAGIKPDKDGSSSSGLRLVPPQQRAITDLVSHLEKEDGTPRAATARPDRPVSKRTYSFSSSTSGPISPVDEVLGSSIARTGTAPGWAGKRNTLNGDHFGSIRDRFTETFRIGENEPNPIKKKGERPIDLIGQDAVGLVERHRWLASAAERARGKPLNEARQGLMQDSEAFNRPNDDGTSQNEAYDAPTPDSDFQQARHYHNQPPPVPTRNSPSMLMRRASAPIGKKSHPPLPPARRQMSTGPPKVGALPAFDSDVEEEDEDENERSRQREGWSQLS